MDVSGKKTNIGINLWGHRLWQFHFVPGEQHIGVEHNIYKRRLDLQGQPLEEPVRQQGVGAAAKIIDNKKTDNDKQEEQNSPEDTSIKEVITCGSCYGAETSELKCCNTCNDVRRAYQKRTWKFDPKGIVQCKGEVGEASEREKQAFSEGCQVYGYLEVNRVGGSFHFGPGKSFSINHVHVHDVQPFSSSDFNLTHTVSKLNDLLSVISEFIQRPLKLDLWTAHWK